MVLRKTECTFPSKDASASDNMADKGQDICNI